jgi:cytochrome P450
MEATRLAAPEMPLPPLAKGLPILGHALQFTGDISKQLVELYKELGGVFRVRAAHREFYVLAGLEANQFLSSESEKYLSNQLVYDDFLTVFNSRLFIISNDGEAHKTVRRVVRRAQSRSAVIEHLPDILQFSFDYADAWELGQMIPVWDSFQHIVTDQLGLTVANRTTGDCYRDFRRVFTWITAVGVGKTMPSWTYRLPAFQNSLQKIRNFAKTMLDERRQNPQSNQPRTIADDVLEAQANNPEAWSEEEMIASVCGPFFAGMDTIASTLAFMLYELLKNPDVLEKCYEEIDSVYDKGLATAEDFAKMPTLQAAAHETLRLYPIGAATPRVALQDFSFGGYRIPKGKDVLIFQTLPHFLQEYYPDPYRFDVTRPMKPPAVGAFAPFSLGIHTCLGAGFADVQMMAAMSALLYKVRFALVPENYQLKRSATPIPNPTHDFKVRLIEKRH